MLHVSKTLTVIWTKSLYQYNICLHNITSLCFLNACTWIFEENTSIILYHIDLLPQHHTPSQDKDFSFHVEIWSKEVPSEKEKERKGKEKESIHYYPHIDAPTQDPLTNQKLARALCSRLPGSRPLISGNMTPGNLIGRLMKAFPTARHRCVIIHFFKSPHVAISLHNPGGREESVCGRVCNKARHYPDTVNLPQFLVCERKSTGEKRYLATLIPAAMTNGDKDEGREQYC